MYCKKCGRKLDENTRFCDRCGQSVKAESKYKSKKKEIEELAESRIERSRLREEKEKQKKEKLNKNGVSDRTVITVIVLIALVILIIPAVISYRIMTKNSENALWRTHDGTVEINATPVPTEKPKQAANESEPQSTPYTITENINKDGYREFKFDEKVFLYPADFVKANTGGTSRLKIADSAGDGSIELKTETASTNKPQELMMEFASSDPANKVTSSRAGDGKYVIDIENSGRITHRKCVILMGQAISYSFTYDADSKYRQLYEQYIEYMDKAFTY